MAVARETVRLGLRRARQAKVKLRQPLHEAVVVAAGREREAIERLAGVVSDELNVKALRFVEQADELGSYEVKPNYRTLGPRFGKAMPQVAAAIAALDPARVAAAVRDGRTLGVAIDGHDHQLTGDDLLLAMQPPRRLPARAGGLARGRARARARRRAAARGARARGRPRRAERAQGGRSRVEDRIA